MKNKKTVFVLGAGASCPYGYPSSARLRKSICYPQEFQQRYNKYLEDNASVQSTNRIGAEEVEEFRVDFKKSSIKSIDIFMANNPKLAPVGKYIIAFEVFSAEQKSRFREEAKLWQELSRNPPKSWTKTDCILRREDFQGEDWCSYLYNRFIEGLIGRDVLPDFSDGKLSFITFNYDRSLEYFLYESIHNSFTEVSEEKIVQSLKQLKILHVYGKIAPLKWQNPDDYIDYKPRTDESLLQRAANNIRTIYEEKQNPELIEAQNLLKQSKQIFFLGFGYAPENMEVLGLPGLIAQDCWVYGTAFGAHDKEVKRIRNRVIEGLRTDPPNVKSEFRIVIEPVDCLEILRNYWE